MKIQSARRFFISSRSRMQHLFVTFILIPLLSLLFALPMTVGFAQTDRLGPQQSYMPVNTTVTVSPEVNLVVSCLAGNGRIDLNIVNSQSISSDYRLQVQGLSARVRTVAFEDWGRMRITGRLPGTYNVSVQRDGVTILSQSVQIDCGATQPPISSPEISFMNACRDGNGYVLFQMVNPTASTRPYVIEFEGVPNRSTSAAPFGQAVRATTGRPDGTYNYLIRTGSTIVDSGQMVVACDAVVNTAGLAWPIDCVPGASCDTQIGFPDINQTNQAFDCGAPGYFAHQGTDIGAPRGTDILAAADGFVQWVFDGAFDDCPSIHPDCQPPSSSSFPGQQDGYQRCTALGPFCGDGNPANGQCYWCFADGNGVILRHGSEVNAFATRYGHVRAGSILVAEGESVQKGQKIAEVASAGASTGNHLHFEVWGEGFYDLVDPWAGACGPNFGMPLWDTGTNTPWE